MDPLSLTASIIAVIQATNEVISICYNYTHSAKGAGNTISRVLEEIKSIRNALEAVENLSRGDNKEEFATTGHWETILSLCDTEKGPIMKELKYLDAKLRPTAWTGSDGSKRKAFMQALIWPLKESETEKTLQNIERWKSTLSLALAI
ncbi:hypothetical protein MMC21_003854 [Puttea exsequens]|nr:hypothetical protein [Puttea exsequens]